jgi:hypothetical protein
MTSLARIRPSLRRAAFVAALGALMVPASAGAAVTADASATKRVRLPVVTRVAPMHVQIGQKLTIRGRNFRRGRNRNTVVFKRTGGKAVFVKAGLSTRKLLRLTVPAKLRAEFVTRGTTLLPTRFRIRVLARKFGKRFTSASRSPVISLATVPPPPGYVESLPDGDCDGDGTKNNVDADDDNDGLTDVVEKSLNLNPCKGDTDDDGVEDKYEFDCDRNGVLNRDETDDDKDLLTDDLEARIGTDACNVDSDGDSVEDGFEYKSAVDLNNDEYQDPNQSVPYPGKKPYPNPRDGSDADTDYDGDSLTLRVEQHLWRYAHNRLGTARSLNHMAYSDGLKYSVYRNVDGDRRIPALPAANYERQTNFDQWLGASNYARVFLPSQNETGAPDYYELRDVNRDGDVSETVEAGYLHSERNYLDTSNDNWLSDDERDEDADGLSNYEESSGRMASVGWWTSKYTREGPYRLDYAGTRANDEDSDGDGIRDGADDQDHDDIPNLMELSRRQATGRPLDDPLTDKAAGNPEPARGRVNPFNPCLPDRNSRTCPTYIPFGGTTWAPFDGLPYDSEGGDPNYLVLN